MEELVKCAKGQIKADLVLKNADIVSVFIGEIIHGDVAIKNGKIVGIGNDYHGENEIDCSGLTVLPGYIDGHMHIESTQLTPSELAKAIVPHGTTTIIADPHEIANVCGMAGVNYLLEASKGLPLDVKMMLPSCVPATPFENSGAILDSGIIKENLSRTDIFGEGEFMNLPGVVSADKECMAKLSQAKIDNKIVDGHAPNATGKDLNAYVVTGIKTDHECMTIKEMKEKVSLGMYVHLREGSATKNIAQNCGFINASNMRRVILCTDDRHALDLISDGHIDNALRKLIECKIDPIWAVTMATLNTAECYGLKDKGAVAPGYDADLVVVDNLNNFNAKYVFKHGELVAKDNKAMFETTQYLSEEVLGTVHIKSLKEEDFDLYSKSENVKVIKLLHNNVVTEKVIRKVKLTDGKVEIKGTDILKLAVIERHKLTGNIGLGLIESYGLKNGAIALTVSHDSHNIIVLGDNNTDMYNATMKIKEIGGGMVISRNGAIVSSMPLEIAGLMSKLDIQTFTSQLEKMMDIAYDMGVSKDLQPFMSLSFLALVVIPDLKITDRGLFDYNTFSFTPIEA